MTDVLI